MSKSISPRLSLTTFRPNYSPKYNPKMHQSPFLSGSTKLKLPENRDRRSASKPQTSGQGLSWSILKIPNARCSKSVVRNWAARRVRAAFEEALRQGGLGKDGTVLVAKCDEEGSLDGQEDGQEDVERADRRILAQSQHAEGNPIRAISGSLLLRVEAATVTASTETVNKDAETVVKWLLKQQQHGKGLRSSEPVPRSWQSGIRRVG